MWRYRRFQSRTVRQAALRVVRERGAAGCVLLGDPAYYSRFGFKPESGLVLPDVPPEYFQALPFGASLLCGVVTYHEGSRDLALSVTQETRETRP
jgi:putative acetyltransferase